MEHFQSGAPVMADGAAQAGGHAQHDGEDGEIVNQIKELLDTRVRPAVAQDGGDITFHGFDRGVVYLHMQGACAGCPSSTLTLKMGIENLLRHYIPEVSEVRPSRSERERPFEGPFQSASQALRSRFQPASPRCTGRAPGA